MPSPLISPAQARVGLVGLRFGLAAGAWLTPRATGRLLGLDPDANPVSPYLARLFGARAAWLGTEIILTKSDAARQQVIRRHVVIDVADLVATMIAWRRGYLSRRGIVLTGLGALAAIGLALKGDIGTSRLFTAHRRHAAWRAPQGEGPRRPGP